MPRTAPLQDEKQVVAALARVLREEKDRLGQGGKPRTDSLPEWQTLLEDLRLYAAQRRKMPSSQGNSAELTESVLGLQQEYQELQHVLMVWSAALKQAIDRLNENNTALTYGPAKSRGRSLGRA